MLDSNGVAQYPWGHGETLTAAALNAAIAQSTGASFGPTPPANSSPGTLWYNSTTGALLVWDGAAWDSLSYLQMSGGTLTGPLLLSGDPTIPTGAATKAYVDAHAGTGLQVYMGGWDASVNAPTMTSGALVNGAPAARGAFWIVTVAATTAPIDGITTWLAGDYIVSNGSIWQRVQASSSPYLLLTGGTITGPLVYTATGAANARAAQDRAHDEINVLDYGARLDGTTNDTAAWAAARAAVSTYGSVRVPRGRQIVSTAPTGGPATPVLWKYDGNYVGASGTTPATSMGTDTLESFVGGSKYFSRGNSVSGSAPPLRVDNTINHAGGNASNTALSMALNTTVTGTPAEKPWGLAITLNTSANSNPNHVALAAFVNRQASATGTGTLFAANLSTTDNTGNGTGTPATPLAGPQVTCELDVVANGPDDAGIGSTHVPAGTGQRCVLDVVGGKALSTGTDCVIGYGVRVDPSNDLAGVSFKRMFAGIGPFLNAVFSTEFAAQQPGAHAIRLATGHDVCFDTPGNNYFQYTTTGTPRLRYMVGSNEQWSIADTGALTASTQAAGSSTLRTLASRASDVINVLDFGADPTGAADSAPAFNAAIASVASGNTVKLWVPRGTYRLNSTVNNNGRNVYVDLSSGALVGALNGGNGTGTVYVNRVDYFQTGGKWYQQLQDGLTAGNVQYDINIQTHAAQPSGYFRLYQQYGALVKGQSDISARESSDWHNVAGSGCALWGTWHTNVSPYLNAADITANQTFALWGMELNITNNGPDYQWTEFDQNQAGATTGVPANWTGGILVTPDVWAPSGSQGGHMQVGFVASSGGTNARTASPSNAHWPASPGGAYVAKIFSGFHAKNDAIAPGGRAFYAGGDTSGTTALFPQAPFEARHNYASGIRTDQATFGDGMALTMAANQGIAWSTGPTIRSGTGAATGTQPKGSLWMRTDGAVGSTMYVSQGGGVWNAVAGV